MKSQWQNAIAASLCSCCLLAAHAQADSTKEAATNGLPPYVQSSMPEQQNAIVAIVAEEEAVQREFVMDGVVTNITVPDPLVVKSPQAAIDIVEGGARANHGRLPVRFSADANSDL